jgi:hypothetical protein
MNGRQPSRKGRPSARRKASARRQRRARRFVPDTEKRWFERACALVRIEQDLRRYGVLIQMQLVLHDDLSAQAAVKLMEVCRRAGFVAYSLELTLISLTGEPGSRWPSWTAQRPKAF